ncbi:nucleotidyltransferase [Guptibacillus algicola]|uniref:nucleotidyltransferase n=1 Tax=Guptibacillus algicola TaxID=225844 RepID=UPI001CD66FA0|nr:nucleotidyltransferase [Alkalihalobacillus algicola]MCA0988417.1 nucleotidyltransferase [Alkalihalobacillus algicola]
MKEVKRIGDVCKVDADGVIVNTSSMNNVSANFQEAMFYIKRELLSSFREEIHSIYVRGSVPRGFGIEGVSDLDMILITRSKEEELRSTALNKIEQDLIERYPFVNGVEMSVFSLEDVLETSRFAMIPFMIKTHSICIYGDNVQKKLPHYRADKALANAHIYHLKPLLLQAKDELEGNEDPEDVKDCCVWIMKIIIRCGLALVIEREQTYTRDLYPAFELFRKHYPEKEVEMRRALHFAVNPPKEIEAILAFLDGFGDWMILKAEKWLAENNAKMQKHLQL